VYNSYEATHMTDIVKLMDQTVSRFVRGALGTNTLGASLDRLRLVREATLQQIGSLSQAQIDFVPGVAKWSIGQIVDHVILTDGLYQPTFRQLIERARAGDESILQISIREMDPTVGPIPHAVMPYVAPIFSAFSTLMPHAVRETLLRVPFIPSANPRLSTPRPGRSIEELRNDLAESLETTGQILQNDLPPSFERMRASHPILGVNTTSQILDLMSAHEQRHQQQISGVMSNSLFPPA
jgi:hypothetical protein